MEKAELLLKTWQSHQGREEATVEVFQKTIEESYKAKQYIRNTFFEGKDKISFSIDEPLELTLADSLKELKVFAGNQTKHTEMWRVVNEMSTSSIVSIFNNQKVEEESVFEPAFDLARMLMVVLPKDTINFPRRVTITHMFQDDKKFSSPKLTKQIVKVAQELKIKQKDIDNILSILSIIQSFAPKKDKNKKAKLVLSVDPIDFATASINDYGWSSCVTPDGAHATMPYGLMLDSYTMIAYVESQRSQYVLFKDGETVYTCSNKKIRRFIHLSEGTKGIVMNKTYPSKNLEFNAALINFFKKAGYEKRWSDHEFFDQCCFEMVSEHVYDDVRYDDSVIVLGTPEDFCIGENPFCLSCGEINSDEPDGELETGMGLCASCSIDFGYANNFEEEEDDDDWYSESCSCSNCTKARNQ